MLLLHEEIFTDVAISVAGMFLEIDPCDHSAYGLVRIYRRDSVVAQQAQCALYELTFSAAPLDDEKDFVRQAGQKPCLGPAKDRRRLDHDAIVTIPQFVEQTR